MSAVLPELQADADAMVAIRRDLHAHPELCFQEHRTSERVATCLTEWGIEVHRGLGRTGVVGVIEGRGSGGRLGLRADMDALPMTEHNTFAHASTVPGRMHACGHDGHTTMLLAAAKHLAATRDFDGTLVLVFQPAEELGGGARAMIEDGLFERFPVDAMLGMHNWPGLPAGHFAMAPGATFGSSNEYEVTVRGRGAHAAMPHDGIDPLPIAARLVLDYQSLVGSRLPPASTAVVTTTILRAGEASNAIAETCELSGTVRTLGLRELDVLEDAMRTLTEASCAARGASCDFRFIRGYPPTINEPGATARVRQLLGEAFGEGQVHDFTPTLGAEDFAYYLQQVPGCYFVIGNGEATRDEAAGPCVLHSPTYDFNDALIPVGASAWVRLVQRWRAG